MSQRIKLPPLVSLVRLREGRGLDQRGLAAELGVSPGAVTSGSGATPCLGPTTCWHWPICSAAPLTQCWAGSRPQYPTRVQDHHSKERRRSEWRTGPHHSMIFHWFCPWRS